MASKSKAAPAKGPGAGKAPTSTRSLWKGAISFGLVHVPIALYSATDESDLNFKMIDKRTMDPVGYKRVNKKSGKEVPAADIVKGIEWENGQFVLLTPEEIAAAYPQTTQTIEIESFIPISEIPFVYLEKPYYTAPINKGAKVYALLREALAESGMVGVAKVVITNKQHLALLMPCGPALILNLLRWGGEIRSWQALELPPQGAKEAGIREPELKMAKALIQDMATHWSADRFRDTFHEQLMKLVEDKAGAGHLEQVEKLTGEAAKTGSNVVDLTELLMRSLKSSKAGSKPAPRKASTAKAPAARSRKAA